MRRTILKLIARLFAVFALGFLCPAQAMPPCRVNEDSIFQEARICGKSREGSLRRSDLTVAGFSIGDSTLEDVAKRFPGSHAFRLSRAMEAGTGICIQTGRGEAVVFSSGDLAEPKVLDSIYMARAETFEKQGARCFEVAALSDGAPTQSGIRLGMEQGRVLRLLHIFHATGSTFAVDYETSPDKAPWVSEKISRKDGYGWVAMSGAYGAFRAGHLRWFVVYAGVSN